MQDMEYLMSMYPSGVKKLQRYVSEACDRMEYKNSPMYDEFPDHIVGGKNSVRQQGCP